MHQPEKRGAVIRGDYVRYPGCSIQTRSAPVWDPQKQVYKLWVLGVAPTQPGITVQGSFSGYYESKDGLNWSLPIVGEVDFGDNKQNNFVTAKLSGRYERTDCVVYDRAEPDPNRRYKLALPDTWHRSHWAGHKSKSSNQCKGGFAVSPDGIHWTETKSPGLPGQDEWMLSLDEKEHIFIYYVKHGGPNGRAIHLSTSRDFENWTEPKLIFWADEEDQALAPKRIAERMADKTRKMPEYNVPDTYRVEVYNMGIFRYESHYIGVPAMSYHTGSVSKDWPGFKDMHLSPYIRQCVNAHGDYTWFYELQLACSRDLYHWQRLGDRKPWLENSRLDSGAYDLQTIIGPAGVVIRGDELWFYYTGINQYAFISSGVKPGYDDYYPDKGAICLAVLRRDGFVSLDAGETAGTMQTEQFRPLSGKLFVNFSGGKDSELCVEVVDARGKVTAKSAPIRGDHPRAEVKWENGKLSAWSSRSALRGDEAALRFTVRNGQLYSYWLE